MIAFADDKSVRCRGCDHEFTEITGSHDLIFEQDKPTIIKWRCPCGAHNESDLPTIRTSDDFSDDWRDLVHRLPIENREVVAHERTIEVAFESFLNDRCRKRPCAVCGEPDRVSPGGEKTCYRCKDPTAQEWINLDRVHWFDGKWVTS